MRLTPTVAINAVAITAGLGYGNVCFILKKKLKSLNKKNTNSIYNT